MNRNGWRTTPNPGCKRCDPPPPLLTNRLHHLPTVELGRHAWARGMVVDTCCEQLSVMGFCCVVVTGRGRTEVKLRHIRGAVVAHCTSSLALQEARLKKKVRELENELYLFRNGVATNRTPPTQRSRHKAVHEHAVARHHEPMRTPPAPHHPRQSQHSPETPERLPQSSLHKSNEERPSGVDGRGRAPEDTGGEARKRAVRFTSSTEGAGSTTEPHAPLREDAGSSAAHETAAVDILADDGDPVQPTLHDWAHNSRAGRRHEHPQPPHQEPLPHPRETTSVDGQGSHESRGQPYPQSPVVARSPAGTDPGHTSVHRAGQFPQSPATPGRPAEELLMSDLDETTDEWLQTRVAEAQYNTPIKPGDMRMSAHSRGTVDPADSPAQAAGTNPDYYRSTVSFGGASLGVSGPDRASRANKVAGEREALLRRRSQLIADLTAHKAALHDRHRLDRIYHQLINDVTSDELAAAAGGDVGQLAASRSRLEHEALVRSRAHDALELEQKRLLESYRRYREHVASLLELESSAGVLQATQRTYEIPLDLLKFEVDPIPATHLPRAASPRLDQLTTPPRNAAKEEAVQGHLLASARKLRAEVDGLCAAAAADSSRTPSPLRGGRSPVTHHSRATASGGAPSFDGGGELARSAHYLSVVVDDVCDKVVNNLAASRSPSPSPSRPPRSILRKPGSMSPRQNRAGAGAHVSIRSPVDNGEGGDHGLRSSVLMMQEVLSKVENAVKADLRDMAHSCASSDRGWQPERLSPFRTQPATHAQPSVDTEGGKTAALLSTSAPVQSGQDLHMSDLGRHTGTRQTEARPATGADPRAQSAPQGGFDDVIDTAMKTVAELKAKASQLKAALDSDNFNPE